MSDTTVLAMDPVGLIALRGPLDVLAPAVEAETGCARPAQRLSTAANGMRVMWMSPDELMLICDHAAAPDIAARLTDRLGDAFATVVVVSDARVLFELTGPGAVLALASLMPVDFARLDPAEVRRTRMAQIPAAIWREGAAWRVMCFRSVARYAETLLRGAVPA
ncbi:sarcosine oxidase subunit gamma family protein [uncultured Jannaschia sp.]|uniref:sarcosine oxidase subunit gamma n=1 Tax=uncultured Jannaschia sp. TaxID=293347 RepID=UPI002637A22F|nr:sarcosine oxidase subunit gamma family protein [uncultured Jannaschia sp.]